jgi:2-phosphosulfolactate phosphatase
MSSIDPELEPLFTQAHANIRFEWGPTGASLLARSCDVLVIVDIFSFTTAVDVAVSRGAVVYPIARRGRSAEELAQSVDGWLAVDRRNINASDPYSLWPGSLMEIPSGTRLVLPSPNGSAIASMAANEKCHVLAGCFRNRKAVAKAAVKLGDVVGVVAAGERWPDDSLRPALEDFLGAGAIIHALTTQGQTPSSEARAACVAFEDAQPQLEQALSQTASSLELIAQGFHDDAAIASELDFSEATPCLKHGAFQNTA